MLCHWTVNECSGTHVLKYTDKPSFCLCRFVNAAFSLRLAAQLFSSRFVTTRIFPVSHRNSSSTTAELSLRLASHLHPYRLIATRNRFSLPEKFVVYNSSRNLFSSSRSYISRLFHHDKKGLQSASQVRR